MRTATPPRRSQLDEAIDAGVDAGRLTEQMLGYFRDLMAVTVGCDAVDDAAHGRVDARVAQSNSVIHGDCKRCLAVVGLIDQTLVRIRQSVYGRVLLEATLIQICHLPDLQAIVDLTAASASSSRTTSPSTEKKKLAPSPHPVPPESPPVPPTSPPVNNGAVFNEPLTPEPPTAPELMGETALPRETASSSAPVTNHGGGSIALSTATANQIWLAAIEHVEEVRQSLARQVERAEYVGPGRMRLVFPAEAGLTMRRCDAPDNRSALVDAVSDVAGERLALEYYAAAPKTRAVKVESTAPKPTRMQRMREIESNPLVRACIESFGAEIVRVDRPK